MSNVLLLSLMLFHYNCTCFQIVDVGMNREDYHYIIGGPVRSQYYMHWILDICDM